MLFVAKSSISIFVISVIGILVGVLCCGWLLHFIFAGLLMISGTECICWGQHALKLIGSWLASRHCSCGLLKQFLVCKSLFWCYSLGSRTHQSICVRSKDTLWSLSICLRMFMLWKNFLNLHSFILGKLRKAVGLQKFKIIATVTWKQFFALRVGIPAAGLLGLLSVIQGGFA